MTNPSTPPGEPDQPAAPDPLAELSERDVSVWLDDLSRELLAGGRLPALIRDRHVVGVTTNPTIFAAALALGDRYNDQLRQLAGQHAGLDDAVFAITTTDVRDGCNVLRPVYDRTGGLDGRVSIEVDPRLARDTAATLTQARALWQAVDRPNLMVKIPATVEGLPAVTSCIAEGISVNVTLIFSLERYAAVMDAYLSGLEQAGAAGRDLSQIASVASFFISRVDTEIDARLDADGRPSALTQKGKAAVANAQLAYQLHEQLTATDRWQRLAAAGARPQRPLWASTGVKDPGYPDTMYVTRLIAPGTVNTMPGTTLEAFADHGTVPGRAIQASYDSARAQLDQLATVGIDLGEVTALLERQGLAKFEASWDELGATVRRELAAQSPGHPDSASPSSASAA